MVVRAWSPLVYAIVLAIFLADLMVPLGVAHGALYVVAVVVAALTRRRQVLLAGASLAAILCLTAYLIQQPPAADVSASYVIANRLISLIAILATAGLGLALIERMEELRRTRDELDQKQQLLAVAGRTAHFGAWSVDLQNEAVTWTEEVARLHGRPPDHVPKVEEAIGHYAPRYRDRVRQVLDRCIHDGTPFDEEWELQSSEGECIWVRVIGEAVIDERGAITGAQGSMQSVDARKRAELSAEASRARLRQMANTMPLFVWTADSEGRLDFLNRYGIEYTGTGDADDLMGEKWLKALHPDDVERTVSAWSHSTRTGEPHSIEFRLKRHDGQYRWHQTHAVAVRNEDGRIERWFGTCIDIEEQRRLADRLAHTLENLDDVFYAFDSEWRFIYINQKGEEISGTSREDLLGQVVWERFPETAGTDFERMYRAARELGRPMHFSEYYEPFDTWLDVKAFPTDEGLAVLLRDITDQRRAEDQLRQSQRLESVGQLTGGIAHDFNNLLTVIMGNAELAAEMAGDNESLRQLTQLVVTAAQRGSDLTRRLLAFARKQALEPKAVDVNRQVAEMETLLRRTLRGNVEIELTRGAGLWNAMIDPGQLQDALLNLCLNARDAMPEGGRLTIETYNASLDADYAARHEEVEPGQYVVVAVSDTGCGIPPENISRVFEPFFTSRQGQGGTGLGLAMVYGFVKQSGGHVKIYSEISQGTTVRLYLPRTHDRAGEDPVLRTNPKRGTEIILLVEDDALVMDYVARQLNTLGYDVIQAPDGAEALELLKTDRHIDLLFTDVVMPGGISGRELANEAVALRPDLKVLYTSGYTENAIVHHGRLDPGVQLLTKPYRRADLANAIRKALAT